MPPFGSPVILSDQMYDRAEASGFDMRYFARQERVPLFSEGKLEGVRFIDQDLPGNRHERRKAARARRRQ